MEQCLWRNHILFKDYLDHVKGVSRKAKQASVKPFENLGLPVQFLRGPGRTRSRLPAIAAARRVESGLVVRTQPAFRFHIQIGLNGRERLSRQMDQEGLKYRQQGNCFVWIGTTHKLRN